jgi:hypothetical protein
MMKDNRLITIALVILLGIFLQVMLIFADLQDTPVKAAIEFTKGYYKYDESLLSKRLCEAKRVVDDVDVIDRYLYQKKQEASDQGYSLWWMKNNLKHVEVETLDKSIDHATVRLSGEAGSSLRSFFGGETYEFEEELELVRDKDHWKVCSEAYDLKDYL